STRRQRQMCIRDRVLFFVDKLPEKTLHNAIYLQKDDEEPMPQFKQGDWIAYEHR
ncbi:MAG: PTS sorbitol transporter subunit IIA, partial [Lactobacillus iners]|nr:PTS sorbitol transporter subunit IIA [Lactobacillus iners]